MDASRHEDLALPEGSRLFPPSDTRPPEYPDALPFIPGVSAVVQASDDGRVTCSWMVQEPDPDAAEAFREQAHALGRASTRVPEIAKMARAGVDPSAEQLREAGERIPPSLLEQGMGIFQAVTGSPEVAARAGRILDGLVDASVAEGWEKEESQEPPLPFSVRAARLRRGAVVRDLMAGSGIGGAAFVNLMEHPA